MATMSGGVVERENTIKENKQVVIELIRKNEFAELTQEELTELFTKLNAENARELTRGMKSYDPAWRDKKDTGCCYGPIDGLPPGSWWGIRMDCSRDRMHDPFSTSVQPGPVGAISVCTSYSNEDVDLGDVLTFTGQPYMEEQEYVDETNEDEELNLESRSLILNFENRVPVRLIRSYNLWNEFSPKTGYRYDGLYTVVDYWIGISLESGARCYKFAFKRLSHQESSPWKSRSFRDHVIRDQPILMRYSKNLNLMNQRNAASDPSTKAINNDTIISRCISAKSFQSRDLKTTNPEEDCSVNMPKVKSFRKRKQSTIDETNTRTKERDNFGTQEVVSTMLGYQSRKMAATDQQNVNVSTIVTRRVSKKLQNTRFDIKLPSECADKPLWNICSGNEGHQHNDDGEDDSLKSPGSRLQNTNISIRTDLYDSSHNLKDPVRKRGTIVTHGGGVFKPRVLGVPRRQLHFAVVDSSPRSSKTITSVKMERMMSLDNLKKSNRSGNNDEKGKPPSVSHQSPELVAGTMTDIISRNTSAHSSEHSYASPSFEQRPCDNRVEENCRVLVNEATSEEKNPLKSCWRERRDETNAEQCERTLEAGLRKNLDHLQSIEPSAEENPSLSDSPPFRGFESASASGFEGLWAKSALVANSLTMEKILDIIAVDKTGPMAKMLISSVIGFPTADSVRIFQETRSCTKNSEPVSQSHDKPEKSTQKIISRNEDKLQRAEREKCFSNIRTRSYVDLGERVTLSRTEQEQETNGSSSRESYRFTGDAVSNANSRESGEFRCPEDNRRKNIAEMAYAEEETQLSEEQVDSNYNETRCSTPSDRLDTNSDNAKVRSRSNKNVRKTSDAASSSDRITRKTVNDRNKNLPVVRQYSNKRLTSRNSVPESLGGKEDAEKDRNGNFSRVFRGSRCAESTDKDSIDSVDCSSKNSVKSRAVGKSAETEDGKKRNTLPGERNSEPRTTGNWCLRRASFTEIPKLNNNVCDKRLANDDTVKKGVETTSQISGSGDEHMNLESMNSGAKVSTDRKSYPKPNGSESTSKKRASDQMRLVKRSRVRTKRKIEIANLVIDMNMSPRCQVSRTRKSRRGGNYLPRRGCTKILEQSGKRRNVDPVKHPTSPLKRVKKNVQLKNSSAKITSVGNSKKSLPFRRTSKNGANSSKNSDGIKMGKNNNSVKRMRRAEKKVTKKKPIKLKKTNINTAKKSAEIPKIIREQDSVATRTKQTDQKVAVQHSRRDVTARTRSGRSLRGMAIGTLGLRRTLLPNSEAFVRKEVKKRKEKESIENLAKQSLSRRELNSSAKLTCEYCKLPVNAKKPKMVSVMTQCSLISDPPQHSVSSVTAISVTTNNECDLRTANVGYPTTSDNGSECVCGSCEAGPEEIKNEIMNSTETKSEAFDRDAASRDFEDDESEENGRPVFRRALDLSKIHRRSDPFLARSDIRSPDKSRRLTLCDRSENDSVPKKGFIRYVASRKRTSAFVPIKSVEKNFRISQLKSIGFKPIKPGIFPPDVREVESDSEKLRTSDSPKIVYSSGVAKRGVHEEYDKYTSEENNVVQYMDSELCYEDIENEDAENEDNACSSDYYEEGFSDVFVQKLEFVKLDSEVEEEDSNEAIERREERGEEELEEDGEELELELEQDEDDVEEEAIEEEEEDDEGDRESEREEEEETMEVEVEEFKTEDYKTEWQAQLEGRSSSCEGTEQTVVDSDGDVPWHGWRKIISNKETYFVGW